MLCPSCWPAPRSLQGPVKLCPSSQAGAHSCGANLVPTSPRQSTRAPVRTYTVRCDGLVLCKKYLSSFNSFSKHFFSPLFSKPAACSGGQENQQQLGSYQKLCGQQDQGSDCPFVHSTCETSSTVFSLGPLTTRTLSCSSICREEQQSCEGTRKQDSKQQRNWDRLLWRKRLSLVWREEVTERWVLVSSLR